MPSIGHFVWILIGSLRNLKSPFQRIYPFNIPFSPSGPPSGKRNGGYENCRRKRAFGAEVRKWNLCKMMREYIVERERALEETTLEPGLKKTGAGASCLGHGSQSTLIRRFTYCAK